MEVTYRCRGCFHLLEEGYLCRRCLQRSTPFKQVGSTFDYQGPAATLVHHFKFCDAPFLAKQLGSLMVVQLLKFDWPLPDYLVPVPLSFTHYLRRGYNQSRLLAEEIGKLIDRPVLDCLKRSSEAFSQMGQNRSQREALPEETFGWKKMVDLDNKTLLLIDDVITTGTTIHHSGNLLKEGGAKTIYALTTCLA